MDGFETCRRIKANPTTKDVPVTLLTGQGEIEKVIQGFELGAVDYITKTFNTTELFRRVSTHIELYQLQRSLSREVKTKTERGPGRARAHGTGQLGLFLFRPAIIPYPFASRQYPRRATRRLGPNRNVRSLFRHHRLHLDIGKTGPGKHLPFHQRLFELDQSHRPYEQGLYRQIFRRLNHSALPK